MIGIWFALIAFIIISIVVSVILLLAGALFWTILKVVFWLFSAWVVFIIIKLLILKFIF